MSTVCRHADGVIALAWHSTRPAVVTASLDRCIRIWDARSGGDFIRVCLFISIILFNYCFLGVQGRCPLN